MLAVAVAVAAAGAVADVGTVAEERHFSAAAAAPTAPAADSVPSLLVAYCGIEMLAVAPLAAAPFARSVESLAAPRGTVAARNAVCAAPVDLRLVAAVRGVAPPLEAAVSLTYGDWISQYLYCCC